MKLKVHQTCTKSTQLYLHTVNCTITAFLYDLDSILPPGIVQGSQISHSSYPPAWQAPGRYLKQATLHCKVTTASGPAVLHLYITVQYQLSGPSYSRIPATYKGKLHCKQYPATILLCTIPGTGLCTVWYTFRYTFQCTFKGRILDPCTILAFQLLHQLLNS